MKELKERNQEIRRARKRGYTYSFIGALFNMSRQRVFQIVQHEKGRRRRWWLLWLK